MKQPKAKATLLSLPRELRDIIYEYAFSGTEVHVYSNSSPYPPQKPGLPLACKQLFAETIELYYKHSIFIVGNRFPFDSAAAVWFVGLPKKNRDAIQDIQFVYCVCSPSRFMTGKKVQIAGEKRGQCKHFRALCLKKGGVEIRSGVMGVWQAWSAGR
ncbi:hypothetical protein PRZ48_014538 [Zasmidium cellare]|uniref:Uncharacterized protein n=1 Tax=Zasmidium cellare TaxID=395010 RepID=A0ABR0DYM2_ZASCE|nr:hypothetical protein PRZ48_014538 [Zasmidium cellare]